MKKSELMNGDIVVTRSGEVAVVIYNDTEKYLLYQNSGWESLGDYDDNMVYLYSREEEGFDAIMQIYRATCVGFLDFEEEEPIYEREYTWTRPGEDEKRIRKEKMMQQIREEEEHKMKEMNRVDVINVMAQQFYGNRTGTKIDRKYIDYFIRGCMDDYNPEEIKDVSRKVVLIPGSDNIVVVYDQTQEDEYVNVDFPEIYARDGAGYLERWGEELKIHVSCEIPEIGFKIHTRCIACRMGEDGVLQGLEEGDNEKVVRYFPAR